MRSGARITADLIAAWGLGPVFHVPGEGILGLLDALASNHPEVRLVSARHEGGMAFMASGAARGTGRPSVCLAARAPGALNACLALHTASTDAVPLLMIIGQASTAGFGRESFLDDDMQRTFAPLAKWVGSITSPARVPEIMNRARHIAMSGRRGPVVLVMPEDVGDAEADVADLAAGVPLAAAPAEGEIAALGTLLAAAQRPLVVVGGSDWDQPTCDRLRSVAARLDVPVATAYRRRDLFDNDDPRFAGELGIGIDPALVRRVAASDLLLVIGARLGELNTIGGGFHGFSLLTAPKPSQILVHSHAEAGELNRVYRADLAIQSSSAAMVAALERIPAGPWPDWTRAARLEREAFVTPSPCVGPVDLPAILASLRGWLPDDTGITVGAGAYALWAQRFFPHRKFGTLIGPKSGAMGYGLPAAIGAAIACPERRFVALAGDGCFMMHAEELATAVLERVRIVTIVFNNSGYGAILYDTAPPVWPCGRHRPRQPGLRRLRPVLRCAWRAGHRDRAVRGCVRARVRRRRTGGGRSGRLARSRRTTRVTSVLVVGAGIAGLTAAWRLREAGYDVTVVEAQDGPGGRMADRRDGDIAYNAGARLIYRFGRALPALIRDLGLADALVPVRDLSAMCRIDGQDRRITLMPGLGAVGARGLIAGDRARLIAFAARLVWLRRSTDPDDIASAADYDGETLAAFADRELGPRVRARMIDPLFRGTRSWDPADISPAFLMSTLPHMLGQRDVYVFAGGMGRLTRELATRLHVRLAMQAVAIENETGGNGCRTWFADGGSHSSDLVVVAVQGALAATLPGAAADPEAAHFLAAVRYNSLGVVHYALQGDVAPAMRFVDRAEGSAIATFQQLPAAPQAGRPHAQLYAQLTPEASAAARSQNRVGGIEPMVRDDVRRLFPDLDARVRAHTEQWIEHKLPTPYPGFIAHLRRYRNWRERDPSRVYLCGDYLAQALVTGACASGAAVADLISRHWPARAAATSCRAMATVR